MVREGSERIKVKIIKRDQIQPKGGKELGSKGQMRSTLNQVNHSLEALIREEEARIQPRGETRDVASGNRGQLRSI